MNDYFEKFRLDNKTAFVVGGLGLIGKEVTIAFSEAGAKTVVIDLDSDKGHSFEKKMIKKGYDVLFNYFDCSDIEKIDKNFSELMNQYGCPDIFINCSYPRTKDWGKSSFKDIKITSFVQNINIQLNSHAWTSRMAAERMAKQGTGGSIIQLGSTYGIVGQDLTVYEGTDMHENMTYAAIKGGITNLTRLMASYYGQYNIRINTLCPGGLEGHVAGKSNVQNQIFVEQYSKKTPLKRLGRAEEIASTALFLASEAASYITGTTIIVDGGWTAV